MKVKELTNAPQWLLDAVVRDEDVEIDLHGRVIWHRGSWDSGNFLDGNFLGGDFWGGNFLGGNFRGGNFLGGNFRGGDFRGGNFLGGNFLGGNFRGGDFRGGNFLGGDFWGGDFLGEALASVPLMIYGLGWRVVVTDARMQIGCEIHEFAEWADFDDARIVKMDRQALRFWRANKAALMALCANRSAKTNAEDAA